MAEHLDAIRKILGEAGVDEPDEIADKIVALFQKFPTKRPRADMSGNFNTKRAHLSSGWVPCSYFL